MLLLNLNVNILKLHYNKNLLVQNGSYGHQFFHELPHDIEWGMVQEGLYCGNLNSTHAGKLRQPQQALLPVYFGCHSTRAAVQEIFFLLVYCGSCTGAAMNLKLKRYNSAIEPV